MTTPLALRRDQASRHVELLTGSADASVCLRLIHDSDRAATAVNLDGTLTQHWPRIVAAQAEGFGVFLVINRGGHRSEDITHIRAQFIDADDAPMPEEWEWHLAPDFTVRRDPTHWHAYWRAADIAPADFKACQRRLAAHYNTDPTVCDPSRVMRLAGTLHLKDPATPHCVELVETAGKGPYSAAQLLADVAELPAATSPKVRRAASGRPISAAQYREVLSWVEPTFKHERPTFYGIARCILDEDVPLRLAADEEGPDPEDLAVAWASGDLWRERTGDAAFRVETWGYADAADFLHDVRGGRSGGQAIGLGTILHHANAAGYPGRLDDRSTADVYAPLLAGSAAEPEGQTQDDTTRYPAPKTAAELVAGDFPRAEYLWEKFILRGHVNLLYGDGGTGKTLLAEHIAVAIAAGLNQLFGLRVLQRQPVLLVLAEDDDGETKARLETISAMLGVDLAGLPIKTWCLPGWDAALAHVADNGSYEPGAFIEPLRAELANMGGPCLLVLDTVSDIATLDENKRLPVNTLCKIVLTGLCRDFGATLLVNAHPSKGAMVDGTHYAGSTAWNNAVRNRLTLEWPKPSSSQRILSVAKANYSEGGSLELYQTGLVFVTAPEAGHSEADERAVVLATVLELLEQGVAIVRANGAGQKPSDLARAIRDRHGMDLEARRVLDHLNTLERQGKLQYQPGGNVRRGQKAGFRRPVASPVASASQAPSQSVGSPS